MPAPRPRRALAVAALATTALLGSAASGATATAAGPSRSAVSAPPDSQGPATRPEQRRYLDERLNGQRAVDALGGRLAEVAAHNGRSAEQLRELLLRDEDAWVDPTGLLLYVDDVAPQGTATAPTATATTAEADTDPFTLHSKPGAPRLVVLDFDGHTVQGTRWNDGYGVSTSPQPPFDSDGSPATWSASEQALVRGVWARVAEDFAPFDVDVTTQEPPADALQHSSGGDASYGVRVLISPTPEQTKMCSSGCGGIAFVGVMHYEDYTYSHYQPAWVFPQSLGPNDEKFIAEAASHEAGHNLGLGHDGTKRTGYYAGHGAWAPVMGVGYDRPVTQWSQGSYSGANNTEDDLVRMQSEGFPLRADDHGTSPTAVDVTSGSAQVSGVIATRADRDGFSVTPSCATAGATITAEARPAVRAPNLDIRLGLLAGTTELAAADPLSAFVSKDLASGLDARLSSTVAAGSTYTVEVDGTGAHDPRTTGYDDYASLGAYTVDITVTCTDTTLTADLAVTAVSDPPGRVRRGKGFTVTDTTGNDGTGDAGASTTTYVLSADGVVGGDWPLTGARSVGPLAAGTASTGSQAVTVPSDTPQGDYHVLACADGAAAVAESDEADNCRPSGARVRVQ